MEDNLYPRSTEYFVPNADMDEQREKAKEAEEEAAKKDLNKLQQIVDRWNERMLSQKRPLPIKSSWQLICWHIRKSCGFYERKGVHWKALSTLFNEVRCFGWLILASS